MSIEAWFDKSWDVVRTVKQNAARRRADARSQTLGMAPSGNYKALEAGVMSHDIGFRPERGVIAYLNARSTSLGRPVRVLDYGCGSNQLARDLYAECPGSAVCTGVSVGDPRTSDQRDKDRAAGLRFVEQESETLPFPSDEHFDLIVSRMTFLHLFDPMRVLRQLYRHLEYGGEMRIHSDALVSQRVFSSNPTSDDAAAMQQVIDQLRAAGINIDVLTNAGYVVVRKPVGALDDLPLQDVYRYRALGPHEGDLYSLKQTRGKKDGA